MKTSETEIKHQKTYICHYKIKIILVETKNNNFQRLLMQNITSDFHIKLKRGQRCSQPEKGENTSYDKNSFGN